MSLDINELSTAATLCTCNGTCSRTCTVCMSPMWHGQHACVRRLFEELSAPSPTPRQRLNDLIEEWIDKLDAEFQLEPWQAEAFRAIMKHGGTYAIS